MYDFGDTDEILARIACNVKCHFMHGCDRRINVADIKSDMFMAGLSFGVFKDFQVEHSPN